MRVGPAWLRLALIGWCFGAMSPASGAAAPSPAPAVVCELDTAMLPAGSDRAWPGFYLLSGKLLLQDTAGPRFQSVRVALYGSDDYSDSSRLLALTRDLKAQVPLPFIGSFRPDIAGMTEVYLRLEGKDGRVWQTRTIALPPVPEPAAPAPAPPANSPGASRLARFTLILLGIIIAGLPFVLTGAAVSGVIEVFVTPGRMAAWFGRRPVRTVLVALTLGLILPVCECGIVPVARRLMRKGLSPSAGLVFLLTDPILNPITIASTGVAFGFTSFIVWGRCLGGIAVALATAAVVVALCRGRLLRHAAPPAPRVPGVVEYHQPDATCACGHEHPATRSRGRHFIAATASEFLEFFFYLTLGAAITAALQTLLPSGLVAGWSGGPVVSVLSLMALAVLLSICSSADAFVALGYPTFPPGAILAFLLFGPVFDLKLFIMYCATFRRRAVWLLAGMAGLLVALIGVAVNLAVRV